MAPEQLAAWLAPGDHPPPPADVRANVYSCGCLLHYLLHGRSADSEPDARGAGANFRPAATRCRRRASIRRFRGARRNDPARARAAARRTLREHGRAGDRARARAHRLERVGRTAARRAERGRRISRSQRDDAQPIRRTTDVGSAAPAAAHADATTTTAAPGGSLSRSVGRRVAQRANRVVQQSTAAAAAVAVAAESRSAGARRSRTIGAGPSLRAFEREVVRSLFARKRMPAQRHAGDRRGRARGLAVGLGAFAPRATRRPR